MLLPAPSFPPEYAACNEFYRCPGQQALLNAIAQFIDSYQRKLRELIAISVILPGLVDPAAGNVLLPALCY
ncbi:ROK family protein [Escherichia coli]|uniref:ROK family protein n=1 Tax=Escherichia coli TaxID=562 RepID=UPI003D8172BC